MKPSWTRAPEWANFLAQDDDGTWYWYELEPSRGNDGWIIGSYRGGKYEKVPQGWEATLEGRP